MNIEKAKDKTKVVSTDNYPHQHPRTHFVSEVPTLSTGRCCHLSIVLTALLPPQALKIEKTTSKEHKASSKVSQQQQTGLQLALSAGGEDGWIHRAGIYLLNRK
jgi:hypothetical protein